MDPDAEEEAIVQLIAERAEQPFGLARLASSMTMNQLSLASHEGATNLLTKAARALRLGDQDRAVALVERAVRMPYDEHEGVAPAAWAAHMMLFNLVADAIDGGDPEGSAWLDAAQELVARSGEPAAPEVRNALESIREGYQLDEDESRRLRTVVARIPERAPLHELELSAAELTEEILAILGACNAYDDALVRLRSS